VRHALLDDKRRREMLPVHTHICKFGYGPNGDGPGAHGYNGGGECYRGGEMEVKRLLKNGGMG
jgi:hypothetical protein